jgi:glycosyltransferase involved in cell wall biosynthesis
VRRLRVALVSLTPLATGGIETHLLQLVRGLKREIEFIVIGDILPELRETLEAEGVSIERITARGKFDIGCVLELRRVFRRRGIAIVHTHDTRGGLLGRLAGRSLGLDCIHTVHTPAFFLQDRGAAIRLYQRAEGVLNRVATRAVVFVSPTIEALYIRLGLVRAAQAQYIPNGLEPFWFEVAGQRAPQRGRRPAGEVRYIYVGRLSAEKDVPTLLRAFADLLRTMPAARLSIVGNGPERVPLERLADELGCDARVTWTGMIGREQVRDLLRTSDVFVLASRFESMSYTLLEAMACGLACIATAVGGNADLVHDAESGLLVPAGDPKALSERMHTLGGSADQRARLGEAARQSARQYSLETMLARTLALYRSAHLSAPPDATSK